MTIYQCWKCGLDFPDMCNPVDVEAFEEHLRSCPRRYRDLLESPSPAGVGA